MAAENPFIAALRIHKRWADLYSLVSVILVVLLLSGASLLADMTEADAATRTGMMIVMASVIIVVCIWQAAGMITARLHHLLLNQPDKSKLGR
jgi:uncharacterized membrane protein YhaH (DUF805 family)